MDHQSRLNTSGTTDIHPSLQLLEQLLRTNSYLYLPGSTLRFSIFLAFGADLGPLEIGSGR